MEYSNTLKLHKNEVVHCDTEEKAKLVLEIAHNLGYKWATGLSFLEITNYNVYREQTCYWITKGRFCEKSYYKDEDKTIISAEEFIERHESFKKQEMEYSNTVKLHDNEVVHCRTEKEAKEVLEIAHDLGYKWCTGQSFVDDTSFSYYREKTCYDILCGELSDRSYYEEIDKTIISAEEFIKRHESFKKQEMKYSDTLKLHDNEVVHCDTEEKAKLVLAIAHNLGYKWCTGKSFVDDTGFYYYREQTCYDILCGAVGYSSFYKDLGKTIISAEEFISRNEIKNHFVQNKFISIERLRSLHSSISYLNTTIPINDEVHFIGSSLECIDEDKSKMFRELQLLNERRVELIESILK